MTKIPSRASLLSCCSCSVAQLCPALFNPMDCSTPGFPVLHQLLEFAQTHVHKSVMPSNHLTLCLLLLPSIFPSIRVFSKEFFTSCGQSIVASALASILPVNIQVWFPLRLTDLISLQFRGLSRVFSSTRVQSSAFSLIYGPTLSHVGSAFSASWDHYKVRCVGP